MNRKLNKGSQIGPAMEAGKLTVEDVLTEQEVLDLLGVKKSQLSGLRGNRRFPFVRISMTARLYLVPDVLRWLEDNRMVLNAADSGSVEAPDLADAEKGEKWHENSG